MVAIYSLRARAAVEDLENDANYFYKSGNIDPA
jgi:hypothetical protein